MARTFNRRPVTIDGPDSSDIKNYTFNYEQWKGIDDGKNFLSVDQSTFSDAQNMYIDSEGLLSSRPSFKHTSLMSVYADTEVEAIYRLHSDEYTMILCVGKKQYVSGELVPTVWISYGVNSSLILAYDSSASYDVKYIDAYDKTYIFIRNKNDDNQSVKLEIFDKNTLSKLSVEDVAKSIYVPTTKIFTGNNEEEGEAANIWTTSEKYLYYYNDVTGISNDAIGKTVTWDGKNITWNDNFKKYLTKDYYNIGDSTIASVAATGAVAWLQSNILYYAVNGAIIYSWDCSSLIDSSHTITKIYFSDLSDIILIHVSDSDKLYHATYIVSCVSTTEDNTLKYPNPTELLSLVGLTPQPDIYSISCEKFIDESAWMIASLAAAQGADGAVVYGVTANYKYNDLQKEVTTKGDIIGVDFTANLLAMISSFESDSDQKKYYRIKLSKRSEDGKSLVEVGRKDYLITTLPRTTNRSDLVVFKLTNTNVIAYVPDVVDKTSLTLQYYVICVPTTDLVSKNIAVVVNRIHLYSYPPTVLRDSPLIALFKKRSYDCTKCDFVNGTIIPTEHTYLVDGITPLESTTSLYNYMKQVGTENHIFTRFSTDTFELYYDKLGELQLPSSITDILYLNNYFFAINNVLYYTENKYNDDGEFLFYLPKKNRNEFDNTINKLHQLSEDTIAIFFTYEIHYAKYDSNLGTYRYYKSKLQFGLLPKSEVVTSDDSVTTYFGTSKGGIVALTYQDFVAATEQTTLRITDAVNDNDRLFFTNYPIKILKYRYWIIFYANIRRVWVYDIRNQSWWKQTTKSSAGDGVRITQMFSTGANHIYFIADNHLYEINLPSYGVMKTETVYLDYGERPIEWYFKSQKLHLGAPNYFKSIQGMTFFDSSEEDYENIFDLETYAYRDKPYMNGEQNVHYDVRMIRTYLLRMHTMKTNEFQFQISSDNTIEQDDLRHQLKLSSISIRYRITGEVR